MTDGWLPDLSRSSGVKYQAIADALAAAIGCGDLRGGDRLPPQRELAIRLGVDLTTITKAYDTARQRGLIEARGRAGSFVSAPKTVAAGDSARVDSAMNMPPELPGGILARAMAETASALLLGGAITRLHYQPAGGAIEDRAAGAALLSRAGLASIAEQVVVTAGGQNALHAILGTAFAPGDAIACGAHVYPGFKAVAARLGLRLVPLARVDAPALEAACADDNVRALYIVPTNDNPTARTLSGAERAAIAAVAERHDLRIIEDDAYGALSADPIAPIASLIPDRCWYVASMSKLISPALRVAFVRAPAVGAALRLAADVHETVIMAPPLNAALVSAWIADGMFGNLLGAMRAEAARRQELAGAVLRGLDYDSHPQGYHLWLRLPEDVAAAALVEQMRLTPLSVIAADRFAVTGAPARAVRVSIGGLVDLDHLRSGLMLLHGHVGAVAPRGAELV